MIVSSSRKRRGTNVGTVLLVVGGIGLLTSGAASGVWVVPLGLIALGMYLLRERTTEDTPDLVTPPVRRESASVQKDVSHIERPVWDTLFEELEGGIPEPARKI